MFNVCPACGIYSIEKEIRPGEGWQAAAVCAECGHAHPFLRLPLWVVTGASGAGKTSAALAAAASDRRFIHLESDILWRAEFNHPENNYREYREVWLRMVKNIHQAGRPVVLYGSLVPDQLEACLERRYVAQIRYLALVCEPSVLEQRLRARPGWRQSNSEGFIQDMLEFNDWFRSGTHPAVETLDTGQATPAETAAAVIAWALKDWQPLTGAAAYG